MHPREYLDSLEWHGVKLGLSNITALLEGLGNPQDRLRCVHVAGTNGKGSVLAFLDAMLRRAGLRTGRFTSPHLMTLNERFLRDGGLIDDAALDEGITACREVAWRLGLIPTFFECTTAVAFRWFAQCDVDIALIETGMGGRLDSTNVIKPMVSVITHIAMDHEKYLGSTLTDIAREKAGILKSGVSLILGDARDEPGNVIMAEAKRLDAPVYRLGHDFNYTLTDTPGCYAFEWRGAFLFTARLGLYGAHQGANAAQALASAMLLQPRFPRLDMTAMREGLEQAVWPCRLEKVLDSPEVYMDAAHNPDGAQALAAAFARPCVLLLAVSSDKDVSGIASALAPIARQVIVTQFAGGRAMPADELAIQSGFQQAVIMPVLEEAVDQGLAMARESGLPLVIAGSLFLAGQARAWLVSKYEARSLAF